MQRTNKRREKILKDIEYWGVLAIIDGRRIKVIVKQYENGKKTGQWELGTDNVNPIELVFYEDDVKIWTQYTDTNIRKYYDIAGNVIRTEDMN